MEDQNTSPAVTAGDAILKPEETVEERVQQEIRRFTVADAKIAELKQAFGDLKIPEVPSPDADKEVRAGFRKSYDDVKKAIAILRPLRTGVAKKKSELKADYLKISQGIEDEAKRLTALIVEIEDPLKKQLQDADEAIEEQKRRIERQEQERIQGRVNAIIDAGLKFDGSFYSIASSDGSKNISVDAVTLRNLTDPAFDNLLNSVAVIADELAREEQARKDAEEEQRRKDEEERRRVEEQKAENDRKAAELKEQEEALQRQRDDLKRQAISGRRTQLEAIGMYFVTQSNEYIFRNKSGNVEVAMNVLETTPGEAWDQVVTNTRKIIDEITTKEKERIAEVEAAAERKRVRDERTNRRVQVLRAVGFDIDFNSYRYEGKLTGRSRVVGHEELSNMEDEFFDRWLQEAKEDIASINKAEEAFRQEQEEADRARLEAEKSDHEKLIAYARKLSMVQAPEFPPESPFHFPVKMLIDSINGLLNSPIK